MERVLTFTLPLFYGRGVFQERWTEYVSNVGKNIIAYQTCVTKTNRYSFGMMPHRHPITVVVGTPIPVEKLTKPTPDQGSPNWQTFLKKRAEINLISIAMHFYYKLTDRVYYLEELCQTQVMAYHEKYVTALKRLYNDYNPIYGNPNLKLVITWLCIDTCKT